MGLLTFGGLWFIISKWDGLAKVPAAITGGANGTLQQLGVALTSPDAFVLPFEVASELLLAALIGSVYLAMNKKES